MVLGEQKNERAELRAMKAGAGQSVQRLSVLGATGSIGQSTLDLVARHPDRFEVVALTANGDVKGLAELAIRHRAKMAVVADPEGYQDLAKALSGTGIVVAAGGDALVEAASQPADCVVASIVGAAGLVPTLAAVRQGRRVALANKECLVAAGELFMREVSAADTELLPVDSEHSAAFQAIGASAARDIEAITLTASGGPFRNWDHERLKAAKPEQALRHPNWSMGAKITIDSATMMNKGLELIEALHLFPVTISQLDCVVHPQSIVHCLVSYRDGSVLAQMASPDMRTPIALALSWPERIDTPTKRLDLAELGQLTFERPDDRRFPAIRLAREAMAAGGAAPAVLNAANEVAVMAFLENRIGFLDIPAVVSDCLDAASSGALCRAVDRIDEILAVDLAARELARSMLEKRGVA